MTNLTFRILAISLCITQVGCVAPTGDWDEDSIGFNRRMANRRMAVIDNELVDERRWLAAENIRKIKLRRDIESGKRTRQDKQVQLAKVERDLANARQQLDDVNAKLASLPPEDPEVTTLRAKVSALQKSIRKLDETYLFLQQ